MPHRWAGPSLCRRQGRRGLFDHRAQLRLEHFQPLFQSEVILADLDLAFGTANLNFDTDPAQGIAEAVFSPDRLDEVFLDRLLAKCSEHLSMLAAPSMLDRTYDFSGDAFLPILDIIQRNAPVVVLDVPHVWNDWTRKVLCAADEIVITATPDLANLRNTKNLFDTLRKLRPNDHTPLLILNQVGMAKRPEIAPEAFCRSARDRAAGDHSVRCTAVRRGRQFRPDDRRIIGQVAGRRIALADCPCRHRQGRGEKAQESRIVVTDGPPGPQVICKTGVERNMFGKRSNDGSGKPPQAPAPKPMVHAEPEPAPAPALSPEAAMPSMPAAPQAPAPQAAAPQPAPQPAAPRREEPPVKRKSARNEAYYDTKSQVFSALIDTIDLSQLAKLDAESAREEIRDIVNDIITIKNFALSIAEQEELLDDICNDVLGYGPLEPLLARDDIADIMVNGAGMTYIEVAGKVLETDVRFRDNSQLLSICQRIVSQVGRRVDESSPICDARLPDGSRVNVIAPPLAIDGTALTIRKFKKDKLTLDQLVKFGAITPEGAAVLQIIGRVRCNVVISGGTGSGKTTLLNCLTAYIDEDERIITCEDSAELQLQQPHVVRLETRPPNIEGEGEITMRDLVKNCLRMRPERIIVGEVRGPEVFRPVAGHEHRS
jgi:pilus assembly protein CpaF